HRLDAVARANGNSDGFLRRLFFEQRRPTPSFCGKFTVCPDQNAFSAADGGTIQEDAEVRCESHAARVRVALTVAKKQIRHLLQPLEGCEERGNFAKAQKAGDVWKLKWNNCMRSFDFY